MHFCLYCSAEWKARQEEVHNYLFQRVKILCDLTEFIQSYHEWQDVREFGVNIDHFREDAGDTPIPEVWRLEAVEYSKRRRPMLINLFSAGGGTGLKCEWAPRVHHLHPSTHQFIELSSIIKYPNTPPGHKHFLALQIRIPLILTMKQKNVDPRRRKKKWNAGCKTFSIFLTPST